MFCLQFFFSHLGVFGDIKTARDTWRSFSCGGCGCCKSCRYGLLSCCSPQLGSDGLNKLWVCILSKFKSFRQRFYGLVQFRLFRNIISFIQWYFNLFLIVVLINRGRSRWRSSSGESCCCFCGGCWRLSSILDCVLPGWLLQTRSFEKEDYQPTIVWKLGLLRLVAAVSSTSSSISSSSSKSNDWDGCGAEKLDIGGIERLAVVATWVVSSSKLLKSPLNSVGWSGTTGCLCPGGATTITVKAVI